MSELFDKIMEIEAKVDAEAVQGAAVLVQVEQLTGLSTALQSEVERLTEILGTVPDSAELPAIIEALDRLNLKVMNIIPDPVVEETV